MGQWEGCSVGAKLGLMGLSWDHWSSVEVSWRSVWLSGSSVRSNGIPLRSVELS